MIKILKPGEYGDYSFIYSIPNCFQISMIIFSDDYSKPLTFPDNIEQYKHCLLLVHKSEHFTLLERKKSKTLYVENHEKPEKNKSFNKKEELIRSESSNYSGSEENSENNDDIDEMRAIIEDIDEKRYSIPYDKNECYLGGNREASNHTSYDEVLAFLENIPKNYEENRKNFTAWKIYVNKTFCISSFSHYSRSILHKIGNDGKLYQIPYAHEIKHLINYLHLIGNQHAKIRQLINIIKMLNIYCAGLEDLVKGEISKCCICRNQVQKFEKLKIYRPIKSLEPLERLVVDLTFFIIKLELKHILLC